MTKSGFDEILLKMKDLDRHISVAPMMDWADRAETPGSTRSYER
jgi:hypothetical protein